MKPTVKSATPLYLAILFCITACGAESQNPVETNTQLSSASFDSFINEQVNSSFDTVGNQAEGLSCASASCHHPISGNGGSFRVWPNVTDPDSVEMQQNYLSAAAFIRLDKPEASALILEPFAGSFPSVGDHGGGDIYFDVSDEDYLKLYSWALAASIASGN